MAGLVPAIHVFLNGGGLVGIVFVQGPAIPAALSCRTARHALRRDGAARQRRNAV